VEAKKAAAEKVASDLEKAAAEAESTENLIEEVKKPLVED